MPSRSFSLVEEKQAEAEFFLEEMKEANSNLNLFELRCYFSAFVSASRSISFSLQAVMNDVAGFKEWYSNQQEALRQDPLARFFVERRNEVQKVGNTRINAGMMRRDETGKMIVLHYFAKAGPNDPFEPIEVDVITASSTYLHLLRELVEECSQRFASDVDPEAFYTMENLQARNLSIEDVEETLGFPRGWTNVLPDEERLRLLKQATSPTMAQWIVREYIRETESDNLS